MICAVFDIFRALMRVSDGQSGLVMISSWYMQLCGYCEGSQD